MPTNDRFRDSPAPMASPEAMAATEDDPEGFVAAQLDALRTALDNLWVATNALFVGDGHIGRNGTGERALAAAVEGLEEIKDDVAWRLDFAREALASIRSAS